MKKQKLRFMQGLALIPFFTGISPLAMLSQINIFSQEVEMPVYSIKEERADKIDAYFAKRNMPLEGYGAKMIEEAEKNDIDWRLIPAIAIKESTGGKFACDYNPFGWNSCKVYFESWDKAIEIVAYNLGGNNPSTARYYKNKTVEEILYHYNGSVIPSYTGEILEFMELIEKTKPLADSSESEKV
jgi:hypothetical protein